MPRRRSRHRFSSITLAALVAATLHPALAHSQAPPPLATPQPGTTTTPGGADPTPAANNPGTAPPAPAAAGTATDGPPAAGTKKARIAGYKGGFFIQTPDEKFRLVINGVLQGRYDYLSTQEAVGRSDESAFSLPRARLKFKGNLFNKNFGFAVQFDMGKGHVSLKDYFLDYRILKGKLHVRAGQWKRPFDRQLMTSSTKLAFINRAATEKAFAAGRDLGIALHNDYGKSPRLEWAVGLFNGTGEAGRFSGQVVVDPITFAGPVTDGKFSNVPTVFNPMLVFRVGYNHGGINGYSEGDLAKDNKRLRFAVAFSGQLAFDADHDTTNESAIYAGLDYAFKFHGFSFTGGVFASSLSNSPSFVDQQFAAVGTHNQAGYVFRRKFHVGLRHTLIAPTGTKNDFQLFTAVFSVFMYGHKLKIQTEFEAALRQNPGTSQRSDFAARALLNLAF